MVRVALLVLFIVLIVVDGSDLDQASSLKTLLSAKVERGEKSVEWLPIESEFSLESQSFNGDIGDGENDLITEGLPGQPYRANFNQYSGYIMVNESHGRSLFYYFVEFDGQNSTSKPLVLWLNGGPGCSSFGVGAMVEHGPFGVRQDGKSLYLRPSSWNKVANMLYLESPVGVGFSYSNTSADYESFGDSRTAQDAHIFLVKWFKRFPRYKESEFYMAGESYAGYYIPELADRIQSSMKAHHFARINLKGIMIGNGMVEFYSVLTGVYDYLRTHALISVQTHQGLIENCVKPIVLPMCTEFQERSNFEMGGMDLFNIVYEPCTTKNSSRSSPDSDITDPCQKQYVGVYLNLPHVQRALHANVTKLSYPWGPCSWASKTWTDSPSTLLPLYKKLILTGLRILLYSGDMDGVIPVTSTEYSIRALNLTVENPWRPWRDGATEQVAGFRVDYQGLTFATVRGAGHEAPRDQPLRVMALAKLFLEDE